tara:strand:- start:83 stop:823 length:741 start_codon:yes stop_codon:yes gene_type:complete
VLGESTLKIPKYLKIKQDLEHLIHSGALQSGDKVPSEHALVAQHGVSRLTVQRAIRDLVADGLVHRSQGSGTYVSETHCFSLIEVRDVVDEIRRLGGDARTEVLLHRKLKAPEDVCSMLDLPGGSEVFQAALLQTMNDEPVAYEERFAVVEQFPDFLAQDFSSLSVFKYLAQRSSLGEIENSVSAVCADKRLAKLLEINDAEPCVRVKRRNWFGGRCITLTRITYAGSRQVLASRYRPTAENQNRQ